MDRLQTVALAGNPNTGKSTIFNRLTGLRQHTGNWAGKTVTHAEGFCKLDGDKVKIVDLPGTYSLYAQSADEEAARNFLDRNRNEIAVVAVVDATCLERGLILVLQIMALTNRVILCVNLMDEACRKGIWVDTPKLSSLLGIPVIGASARGGDGIGELKREMKKALETALINMPLDITHSGDYEHDLSGTIELAESVAAQVTKLNIPNPDAFDRRLDMIVTSKRWGIPIMLLLLAMVFWLTIVGSNYPSELLRTIFNHAELRLSEFAAGSILPAPLSAILIDGVFRTLTWIVAVMLPPMAIFFPLFTILEDFGLLPRIAFNLDGCFQRAKAHGKQALCMCMGFGCNAAGVVSTRIIDSKRDRLIAILTNNFVPCNGRYPALIVLSGIFMAGIGIGGGSVATSALVLLAIVLSVLMSLAVSRLLSETVLKGLSSSFVLELPPYRRPQFLKVVTRSIFDRTLFVLARAVVVAAPAGALVWLLQNTTVGGVTLLSHMSGTLEPLGRLLGMDGVILSAFLLGMPANEIVIPIMIMCYAGQNGLGGIGGLSDVPKIFAANGWTATTALCTMVFFLNHFPCTTTLLTIASETKSVKWTLAAFLLPTSIGMLLCFLIARIL